MLRIGVTGGIGSGKSTICNEFAALGIPIIDTDIIAHQLTAPNGAAIDAIRNQFGDIAIDASGAMDRAAIRQIVFADPQARARLEAILHPMIRQASDAAVAEVQRTRSDCPYVVLAIPLLVDGLVNRQKPERRVDRILVVDCLPEEQIIRVIKRSGLSREVTLGIMQAQVTRQQRLQWADDIVANFDRQTDCSQQVARLHLIYCRLEAF